MLYGKYFKKDGPAYKTVNAAVVFSQKGYLQEKMKSISLSDRLSESNRHAEKIANLLKNLNISKVGLSSSRVGNTFVWEYLLLV